MQLSKALNGIVLTAPPCTPQGEIYMQFEDLKAARNALANLNGRWFGGHQISASYISDAIMKAHA
jgi:RNA-binding protein 39